MFDLLRLAGTLKTWQIRYCNAGYSHCARYQLAQRGQPIPPNLMPHGELLRLASRG